MNPDEIAAATQSPIVVYIALGIAVATMIVNAFPKLLGPLGKTLSEWSQRRRAVRIAEEDFQIKDLREENEYLQDQRAKSVAREHRWAREANVARVWMRKAWGFLTDHDIEIEPYPDLMTPDPPTGAAHTPTHKETPHG